MNQPEKFCRCVPRVGERTGGTVDIGVGAGRRRRGLQRAGGIIPDEHGFVAGGLDEQGNSRCR